MKGWKYQFCLMKTYLDTGWSLTSYVKYALAFFGLKTMSLNQAIASGVFYMIFCFLLGLAWYKWKFIEANNEVANNFNLFQREVRKHIGKKEKSGKASQLRV